MNTLYHQANQYLSIRRELGFKLRGQDRLLTSFIDYLDAEEHRTVCSKTALEWATLPDNVQRIRWAQRLGAVRGLARFLHGIDPSVEVPPLDLLPVRRQRRVPYLYTQNDIAHLLQATSALKPMLRAVTYKCLFGLLAATGMRVGEAISLNCNHVDLDTGILRICDTKFRKNRYIPLHSSGIEALCRYAAIRNELCPEPKTNAFFVSTRATRLLYPCVNGVFRQCMKEIDLENNVENKAVRLHGLRHSFAVATLRDWYRSGANAQIQLPILSAYLGHGCTASTYWYLQSCPELLQSAAERLEHNGFGVS